MCTESPRRRAEGLVSHAEGAVRPAAAAVKLAEGRGDGAEVLISAADALQRSSEMINDPTATAIAAIET